MNDIRFLSVFIMFFAIYFSLYSSKHFKKNTALFLAIIFLFVIIIIFYPLSIENTLFIFYTSLLIISLHNPITNYLRSINKKLKENKLIKNTVVIPYYNPPADIHPAIAGFLIDKRIGKREYFATLFNTIINGTLVIDEQTVDGKYKYYLIKNKGHKESISCDRIVSNHIFFQDQDKRFLDSIPFEKIKINSSILSEFINNKLIKLNYFKDPCYTPKRPKITIEDLEKYKRKKIEYIKNIYKFHRTFLTKSEKEHHKRLANKKIDNLKDTIEDAKRPRKIRLIKKMGINYFSKLGIEERAKWLGFKDYLQTAERFRLNEEKVETFSKYLPYAVALGVQTQWAKRFENINIDRLEWFRSQKSGSIRRHDSQKVYFKHLVEFLGQIYTKQ